MKTRIFFLAFIFNLLSFLLHSQGYEKIKGIIIDEKTNDPVIFVNISICNESIGLASNEFGEFSLNIPKNLIDKNICISAIGYESYSNSIQYLLKNDYNKIFLSPVNYELSEVVIAEKRKRKFSNPVTIIEMALKNYEQNYPFNPFIIQGYYREYVKYGDNNYLNLFEAGIISKDVGFQYATNPVTYMLQYRYNENFNVINVLKSVYTNNYNFNHNSTQKYMPNHTMPDRNELSILFLHDAIRRYNANTFSYINQLNKDFIPNHKFNLDKIIATDGIPVYQISFIYKNNSSYCLNTKEHTNNYNIKGEIYIESNTYAIKRIEYTSYSLRNPNIKNYEIITEYQRFKGKMYLKYLSFSNSFNLKTSAVNITELNLPIKESPLHVIEANIDHEVLILKFNKSLNKLSANNRRNYELDGQIEWFDNSKSEQKTYQLPKYPDDAYLADSRTVFLKIPNLYHIIKNNDTISIDNPIIKLGKIKVTITDVRDKHRNRIDDNFNITMYQFRELFVNEIPDNLSIPNFARRVYSTIPLHNQKPFKKVGDFWENFNYPPNIPFQNNYK